MVPDAPKLLIAGSFAYSIYEDAFLQAWKRLGYEAEAFKWGDYFKGALGRLQANIPAGGPALQKLNTDLRRVATEVRPNIVLLWRATPIFPSTYRYLRQECGALVVSYNNDDPFGSRSHNLAPWHHRFLWRLYRAGLREADLTLVYRRVNLAEALDAGASRAEVMKPYFIPERDRPITLNDQDRAKYDCDIVFAGHFEPDGRVEQLSALDRAGLDVRLYGGGWSKKVLGGDAQKFWPVREVVGEEYIKALCGARMCLAFLSKLNRDTYTRRCFEIPACGRLLLAERTRDLMELFTEDKEAVFFSSSDELVEKATWLQAHPDEAFRISVAGRQRVQSSGHSIDDRVRAFAKITYRIAGDQKKP